ncbi:MAG: hypothetical protein U0575_11265 [Phycisphaerales bacterium]
MFARSLPLVSAAMFVLTGAASAGVIAFTASGDAANIQPTLDGFRAALGPLNPNTPGSAGAGRREINWDAVPDTLSSPNLFPPDFFNFTAAPRARGALFSVSTNHFEVSAKTGNPSGALVEFGNVDPSYVLDFSAFSPQRIFAPIGVNEYTTEFFVPGTVTTKAAVKGFGAVLTDVDLEGQTLLQCYDENGYLLAEIAAPAAPGDGQFSFVGVAMLTGERIAKVVIVNGTLALAAGNVENPTNGLDVVAIDDLIYGEPVNLACPTDLNGDGQTDGADLGIFLAAWGPVAFSPSDFNGDGLANGGDLGIMLAAWGPCQ